MEYINKQPNYINKKRQMHKKVTIISPYYNRGSCVQESIDSLINQTYKNLEILLINDGSTDQTLRELKKFEIDPRVRVINHENWGFTKSLIHGFEQATGEYVAVHGSGDVSLPNRIERQVLFLEKHTETGGVGAFYRNHNLVTGKIEERRIPASVPLTRSTPFEHGAMMFRKTIYDQVGGYRQFFTYSQCIDLYLRIQEVSRLDVVPEILYTRCVRPDGCAGDLLKRLPQSYYRNIALQCADERKSGQQDTVSKYGMNAWIYRIRNSEQAKRILVIARLASKSKDRPLTRKIIKMSLAEKPTLIGLALAAASLLRLI